MAWRGLQSIGEVENVKDPQWMTVEELTPGPAQLFADGVEPGDVCQGVRPAAVAFSCLPPPPPLQSQSDSQTPRLLCPRQQLGDCWFLGALAVMASREDLLRKVVATAVPEKGLYSFRFSKFGEWHEVVVDDRIPVAKAGPLFASGKNPDETWTMLIEKAYAKLHRTYGALVGGWVHDALVDM